MKFVDDFAIKTWILATDDGVVYRTDHAGENWERQYGDSWETIWGNKEEEECKDAWKEYFKTKCSICGTTKNVRYVGGDQPWRCDSVECAPFWKE